MKTRHHRFPALFALSLVMTLSSQAVEIVGHRGASFDAPENTVASARLAFQNKADAQETDIWLTKDKQLIVSHDLNAKRTTGRDVKLSEITFDEARQLDAGTWKNPKFAGEKLPSLDELMEVTPPGKRIFIEIKAAADTSPEVISVLKTTLDKTKLKRSQLVIITFSYPFAKLAKATMPDIPVLWLLDAPSKDPKKSAPDFDEVVAKAKAARLDGLDVNFKFPMDAAKVKQLKAAGLQLHVWTVDDPVVARQWIAYGVDGITTNRAGWLREQLAAQ